MITVNHNVDSNNILELVKKAETKGERIVIEREGKGKVAIINYADLRLLEELEDARDCTELRQAIEESKGKPSITFNELLDELGLTIEDLTSGDEDE
ncbi:type II toxin-antitoxin system prevent-host-death family antitoxin [Geminocystis herdmanii]|uniref:type II toxin-antitoxin system prevent-host-death family antitoxin n=1 Tax=Geminocystis herdmanii TaxID=669359 RepID=UPI0003465791|nr:type II toxin-antitoxin system prevent-host-death family antitoxin [Geminocystis herdmanii]